MIHFHACCLHHYLPILDLNNCQLITGSKVHFGTTYELCTEVVGWTETCSLYHEGSLDSTDIATSLFSLKDKWDGMLLVSIKYTTQLFTNGFKVQGREVPSLYIAISKRRDKIGSPPKAFYTNVNEAINAKLKECLGYNTSGVYLMPR